MESGGKVYGTGNLYYNWNDEIPPPLEEETTGLTTRFTELHIDPPQTPKEEPKSSHSGRLFYFLRKKTQSPQSSFDVLPYSEALSPKSEIDRSGLPTIDSVAKSVLASPKPLYEEPSSGEAKKPQLTRLKSKKEMGYDGPQSKSSDQLLEKSKFFPDLESQSTSLESLMSTIEDTKNKKLGRKNTTPPLTRKASAPEIVQELTALNTKEREKLKPFKNYESFLKIPTTVRKEAITQKEKVLHDSKEFHNSVEKFKSVFGFLVDFPELVSSKGLIDFIEDLAAKTCKSSIGGSIEDAFNAIKPNLLTLSEDKLLSLCKVCGNLLLIAADESLSLNNNNSTHISEKRDGFLRSNSPLLAFLNFIIRSELEKSMGRWLFLQAAYEAIPGHLKHEKNLMSFFKDEAEAESLLFNHPILIEVTQRYFIKLHALIKTKYVCSKALLQCYDIMIQLYKKETLTKADPKKYLLIDFFNRFICSDMIKVFADLLKVKSSGPAFDNLRDDFKAISKIAQKLVHTDEGIMNFTVMLKIQAIRDLLFPLS